MTTTHASITVHTLHGRGSEPDLYVVAYIPPHEDWVETLGRYVDEAEAWRRASEFGLAASVVTGGGPKLSTLSGDRRAAPRETFSRNGKNEQPT